MVLGLTMKVLAKDCIMHAKKDERKLSSMNIPHNHPPKNILEQYAIWKLTFEVKLTLELPSKTPIWSTWYNGDKSASTYGLGSQLPKLHKKVVENNPNKTNLIKWGKWRQCYSHAQRSPKKHKTKVSDITHIVTSTKAAQWMEMWGRAGNGTWMEPRATNEWEWRKQGGIPKFSSPPPHYHLVKVQSYIIGKWTPSYMLHTNEGPIFLCPQQCHAKYQKYGGFVRWWMSSKTFNVGGETPPLKLCKFSRVEVWSCPKGISSGFANEYLM